MPILYPVFERARMIRKGSQLVAPIVSTLDQLQLPQNSLLHYLPDSKIDVGPGSDHPLFKQITKPIMVYTPLLLLEPINQPRKVTFDSNPIMRGYYVRNRRFRKLLALDKMPRDDKTLIVANYSLIHHSYKYTRSLYADYNEWTDLMYTVTSEMNRAAEVSQRNQWLIVKVPEILPAISRLNNACRNMDQNSLKLFHTPGARFLLELWKWVHEEDYKSVFDRIEVKNLRFMNLIIEDTDQWISINLEKLYYWQKNVADEYNAKNKQDIKDGKVNPRDVRKLDNVSYPNAQLQKYLLRMYMVLSSARSVAGIDADAPVKKALVQDKDNPPQSQNPVSDQDTEKGDQDDRGTPEEGEVDEDGNPIPIAEDEEELHVKKERDLADSVGSSKSLKGDAVKSSEEILRDAAKLNEHEDDDSSKGEIGDEVNAMIDADLAELEALSASEESKEIVNPTTGEVLPLAVDDTRPYEHKTKDRLNVLAEAGLMTAAEYRRLDKLSEKYKTLPHPFGGKGTLLDAMHVTEEETALTTDHIAAPNATVVDESMLYSNIEKGQQTYIKHTLNKHVLKMITHVQSSDVILDNIEAERSETIQGSNINLTVRLIPIEGAPSTIRFPIPEIQEDGTYTANGVKYVMRNQRGDWPIRKVASNRVALTSYFGKFFVYRSRKSTNDYGEWICNEVLALGFDAAGSHVSDVKTADVFSMNIKAPRSVSSLSKKIREFTVKATEKESFVFNLDLTKINETYDMTIVQPWIDKGFVPIAKSNLSNIVYYEGDSFYLIKGEKIEPLGELEDILAIDVSDSPAEFVELKIAGKFVPIGMILAYDYGLAELIKRLKIKVRRVPVGTRTQQQPDEVALVFSDETLLFSKSDRLATLLLGGFLEYRRVIRGFSIYDFDQKGVYQNVLDSTGGGTRVLREIKHARDMFVDPITKEVLLKLKQPTDFMGILVFATELLMDDMHRPELDMSEMRIKGYERVAGAVYQELVKSMRDHHARPGKSRYAIEMKPYAIWQALAQDPSIVVVKDINPIENLKQREEVTFTGAGGRSKDTMTAATREYGKNDEGLISEATKDSGEVGINTYLAPNPNVINTLGMPVPPDQKTMGMSSIFSSSVLASPGATRDDMKRMGFISIQHSHGVAVKGQMENILSTGYESVIAHRAGELFAVTAKQKGTVKEVTDHGIMVQYADGSTKGYPLGRQFGENAGMTIPHTLVTPLKVGSKFIEGDAITFNKGYFKPSTLNPRQVSWCNGTYANFALCEPTDVIEDASVIVQELANMLMTEQTKQRTIIVSFKQAISRLVKVGDALSYDDVLCIIQDEITSSLDLYDDADIDTLKALGSQAPKAKYDGVVERIEVFYRGDKEDMSDAIRKIVNQSDREVATRRRATNKNVVTGEVDEGFKVKGNSIPLDSVAIRISITGPEPAGVGDKIVLVNQLKSIIGKVLKEPMKAKDGTKILGRFSYTSVARRIVNSADITGTTVPILIKGAELAVAAYDS